jgi:hypothetical protein
MSTVESKLVDKKIPHEWKDRFASGRYKEMGGNNPYKKAKFIGECEELKDCIFDFEGDKQGETFEANLKKISIYAGTKYDTGSDIMTTIDEMSPVTIKKPEPYIGDDPIETKSTTSRSRNM